MKPRCQGRVIRNHLGTLPVEAERSEDRRIQSVSYRSSVIGRGRLNDCREGRSVAALGHFFLTIGLKSGRTADGSFRQWIQKLYSSKLKIRGIVGHQR